MWKALCMEREKRYPLTLPSFAKAADGHALSPMGRGCKQRKTKTPSPQSSPPEERKKR